MKSPWAKSANPRPVGSLRRAFVTQRQELGFPVTTLKPDHDHSAVAHPIVRKNFLCSAQAHAHQLWNGSVEPTKYSAAAVRPMSLGRA
jgi:hypothetical protein